MKHVLIINLLPSFIVFFISINEAKGQSTVIGTAILTNANLKTDLVNYYPFNGNANDSSGNSYHGTVYGATLANDRFNNPQSCYHFNGNEYIQFPLDSAHLIEYTILGWTMIDFGEGNISSNRHILSIGDTIEQVGFAQYPPCMNCNCYQGIYYVLSTSPFEYGPLAPGFAHGSTATSAWRHYGLVVDSIAQSWGYAVNGFILGSVLPINPFSPIQLNNKTAKVGCRFDNNYYYKGFVDDIRIYKRALTPCEIRAVAGAFSCQDTLCENNPNSVYYAEADGATSYIWNISPSGAAVLNPQGDSCIIAWTTAWTGTATLTVQGQNINGTGPVSTKSILIIPSPQYPIISINGDTLTSNVLSGNQWYLNGIPISGATNQTYIAVQSGYYYTIVSNYCGSEISDSVYIIVNTTGIEYSIENALPIISPNPTTGEFTIFGLKSSVNSEIKITNALRQVVFQKTVNSKLETINLSKAGIYFLQVKSADKIYTSKIIIE